MNAWVFVLAAYSVAVVLSVALLAWAFVTMRRAESVLETLPRR